MLKMTGLDSFLSIWSDYLSCFVSLVVVFAYLVILWISCYPLNILSCFEYALVTCIFPLVRSGRPSASLAPASSCSSSTMASSSIVSICSSAITHSFAGSSNVLSILTKSTLTVTLHTHTHTHTHIYTLTHRIATWGWRRNLDSTSTLTRTWHSTTWGWRRNTNTFVQSSVKIVCEYPVISQF